MEYKSIARGLVEKKIVSDDAKTKWQDLLLNILGASESKVVKLTLRGDWVSVGCPEVDIQGIMA